MTKRRFFLLLVAGLLPLPGCQSADNSHPPVGVTLATGPDGGYYQKTCSAIREVGLRHGLDITCKVSAGSRQNVDFLEQDQADFALVQSDAAHRAWKGEYPFDEKHDNKIRLVTPLFTEKVHILVRPHLYLASVAQLKNKRIWIGAKNSGSRLSAITMLRAAGLEQSDLHRVLSSQELDSRKALALVRGEDRKDYVPLLDAVIDQLPGDEDEVLSGMLESLGIKKQPLALLNGEKSSNVLLRPDLNISGPHDWKGRRVWLNKGCCLREAATLAALGAIRTQDMSARDAVGKLQRKEIDALIQPAQLDPGVICGILAARYKVLPDFAPDPRGGSKKKLAVFLRRSSSIASGTELVGKKVWWPDHEMLDKVVLPALVPGSGADVDHKRHDLDDSGDMDDAMARQLLALGELDAVFQTTVAPSPKLGILVNRISEISLLGIDWALVEKLIGDGSYVETSLQPTGYPGLNQGAYTVGVQSLLLTRLEPTGGDGQKVRALARFLRREQGPIEARLRQLVDQGDKDTPGQPYSLTLLGSPLDPKLASFVHPSASEFLVTSPLRPKTMVQVCLLAVAILVAVILGSLLKPGRKIAAFYPSRVLFALACIFLWAIGAIWLQALEGDLNQEFVTLPAAGFSLVRTVIAHFGLPTAPPAPTTRNGQLVMNIFSWVGVLLVGGIFLPALKSFWARTLDPLLKKWRSEGPSKSGEAAAQPEVAAQPECVPQPVQAA